MSVHSPLRFKIATTANELEQIRRLNYRTFVEEIPQHAPNADGVLQDRFEDDTTYVICLRDSELVGMISVRGTRPFSLDAKLHDVDSYLPEGRTPCEIRLLAVERANRTGIVFRGLARCLVRHCLRVGYDIALISGTERQLRLYEHMGFVPFGPRVGTPGALYQPMYLTLENFRDTDRAIAGDIQAQPVSFLPGPVTIDNAVRRAFEATPESHRAAAFVAQWSETKGALLSLTGAQHVELMMGSGTLANDVIGGQISRLEGSGLVLANGEFGERLINHATRWRLNHTALHVEWGEVFTRKQVEQALDARGETSWLWATHCETSTGVLNDISMLKSVCEERGIRLCMDCISSIAVVPLDLGGVYLASAVSGKAIGAPPGIAMVFHDHPVQPSLTLPRYLDLGLYAATNSTPFTFSSNLLSALRTALRRFESATPLWQAVVDDAHWLRHELRAHGFHIPASDAETSPAVTTIALPAALSSIDLGDHLEREGLLVSYRSDYLIARNWIQVCLMGNYRRDCISLLLGALVDLTSSIKVA